MKGEIHTTASSYPSTMPKEDFKKAMGLISSNKFKKPELPKGRKIGLFEKLMNKLGWYRQTEYIIIDRDKLDTFSFFPQKTFRPKPQIDWRLVNIES